ncbi:MAG: C-terminal binding protein [Chloroflexi bacterium]|nr:C-terminal binding protein [Chloroflexota bacterium]
MPRFRVAVCQAPPDAALTYEREALDPIGADLIPLQVASEDELVALAGDVDGLLPRGLKVTARLIQSLPNLKVISTSGIGTDAIDLDAATERGVVVANIHDVFVDEVANHAMALLLALAKKIVPLHQLTIAGKWGAHREIMRPMPRITGEVLGLVAFGNIARAVARRAQAFDMRVIAFDPYVPPGAMEQVGVRPATLDQVFAESDFISAHVPLTKETYHLVDEPRFRLMKSTAYFINTGRGRTVDEVALIRALQAGWIAGAGLDVLEQEPPDPGNPLLHMANMVITPHMASVSDVSDVERRRRAGENVARVLQGRQPRNVVNRAVLGDRPHPPPLSHGERGS